MTSICEKKISAEVRLIHAEQMSLYNFKVLRKNNRHSFKTKQVNQDILNQWECMGFPKLYREKKCLDFFQRPFQLKRRPFDF